MKSLLEFIPNLFIDYSETISNVSNKLSGLTNVSVNSSAFQNAVSTAKLVTSEVSSSKISANIFDVIENLEDLDYAEGAYVPFHHSQTHYYRSAGAPSYDDNITIAYNVLKTIYDKAYDATGNVIGYIDGKPVFVFISESNNGGTISNWGVSAQFYMGQPNLSQYPNPLLQYHPFLRLDYTGTNVMGMITIYSRCDEDEDMWNLHYDYINDDFTVDEFAGMFTLDAASNKFYNDYVSNDCVLSIIKRAQTDGTVTRSQIESILNQYESTDVTEAIRSMIAGTDKLSHITVVALVGKLYDIMGFSYSNGSNSFVAYDDKHFIHNIIQAVVRLVVTIIATLLTILFRSIGFIIQMALNLISQLFEYVNSNVASTESEVTAASLVPLIDNPVVTITVAKSKWDSNLGRIKGFSSIDIDELIAEEGCAMITPPFSGSAPWYMWILPKDEYNYTCQILITAAECKNIKTLVPTTYSDNNWTSVEYNPGHYWYFCDISYGCDDATIASRGGLSAVKYVGHDDLEYKYLSMTDEQMRKAIALNLFSFISSAFLWFHSGPSYADRTYNIYANYLKSSDGNWIDYNKLTISNLLDTMSANDDYTTTHKFQTFSDKLDFLGMLSNFYLEYVAGDVNDPPTWSEMDRVLTLLRSASDLEWNSYLFPSSYPFLEEAPATVFVNEQLSAGTILATTSVKWPNIDRNDLTKSLVIAGLTAAAITAVTVVAKVGLRKVAFNKLAVRQVQFNNAQKRYERMQNARSNATNTSYTDEEVDKITNDYYRANRRLTRAWNFAGKFGLSMFNGFSTSSNDVMFIDDATSPLTSVANSDALKSASLNSSNQSSTTDLSRQIYAAICGIPN